jgi:hypothetical protein
MSFSPLYTVEIENALENNSDNFLGVFASDELPYRVSGFPASLVANTDPASRSGAHWVAFYFDGEGHMDYFDSQGLPPSLYPKLAEFVVRNARGTVRYCDLPLQGFYTAACGYYCIAFLALRSRGVSLSQFTSLYWGGKPGVYDENVSREVSELFKVGRRSVRRGSRAGGGGYGSGSIGERAGQCSCSVAEWCERVCHG